MDFASDNLSGRRRVRVFCVLDGFTRECLANIVDKSVTGGIRVAVHHPFADAVAAVEPGHGSHRKVSMCLAGRFDNFCLVACFVDREATAAIATVAAGGVAVVGPVVVAGGSSMTV